MHIDDILAVADGPAFAREAALTYVLAVLLRSAVDSQRVIAEAVGDKQLLDDVAVLDAAVQVLDRQGAALVASLPSADQLVMRMKDSLLAHRRSQITLVPNEADP